MLLSELKERGRRFRLALRVGVPILMLIVLVFYITIFKRDLTSITIETTLLLAGITFITIYFIYFLLEEDARETLVDQATQGFNQRTFIRQFQAYQPKTLALLVIKNLGTMNENYSPEEIDRLLHSIIHRLDDAFAKSGLGTSLIGRRYGAEFLVALDKERQDLQDILEQFIQENSTVNAIEVDYGLSMITDVDKENLEKIIAHLKDKILAEKKGLAPKRAEPLEKSQDISHLEEDIIEAVESSRLNVLFRPLLNVASGKVDIYEVAVRLISQSEKDILPRVYLPVVNRLGLGRQYDYAIFTHLVDLLPLVDSSVAFSFNLSPFSLRDSSFQEKMLAYIDEKKIDASRLIIELYERKTHHNLGGYLKVLNRIRAKGIRIAIDNFGSSNASMEYIKHFSFDMVQFDRDYVTKLDDKNTNAMLASLIDMAKNLEVITVAKWVDRPDQKEKLTSLGIGYVQGFGIGKPISEHDLVEAYN